MPTRISRRAPHVARASFLWGVASAASLPPSDLPEIAFAGRSNVGKSSLIERLLGVRGLLRISSTPGRTRQVNLFQIDLGNGDRSLLFADLPGYGFAKVSRRERRSWGPLVESYLEQRSSLRCVVVIIDVRRGVEPDDQELAQYLRAIGQRMVVVATKTDKLAKNKIKPAVAAVARAMGEAAIGFSAVSGDGREELWETLLPLCDG